MTPSFHEPTSSSSSRPRAARSATASRAVAAACAAASLLLGSSGAHAQTPPAVGVDGKGIVGGALLGAEVVDLTIGIIGVKAWWPYLVFGAAGAVGGGIGGYFVEQETRGSATAPGTPEPALYMLAGGMALVIPTIIVSLNATMYHAPEGTSTTTVEPADNQPATSPGQVQPPAPQTLPSPVQGRLRFLTPQEKREHLTLSMIDIHRGNLALSAPAVQVRPLYSPRELWTYGVRQGTEVSIPVFSASF